MRKIEVEAVSESDVLFEITDYGSRPLMRAAQQNEGFLFLCVSSGKLRAMGNGADMMLSSGDCLVMSLGRGYKLLREGDSPCITSFVTARGRLVYDLVELYSIGELMPVKAPEALEALNEIQKLMSELDESFVCAMALHRFLQKVRRASLLGSKNSSGSTAEAIKAYIDSHLEGKLTLDELSKIFFVSKTQIFRIFKEAYDVAPMQYFLKQKIELAKRLLSDGNMRISEIAESLSFTDAKHFSKTFRKFTGELPRNYRRKPISSESENK